MWSVDGRLWAFGNVREVRIRCRLLAFEGVVETRGRHRGNDNDWEWAGQEIGESTGNGEKGLL